MIERVEREPELLGARHPEVVGGRANREHQRVVGDPLLPLDEHLLGVRVDADDGSHPALDVGLVAQDRTHRVGDVAGVEPRRRDLIEQRLEGVVVVAVDDDHVDRLVRELLDDVETREAGTDHDDTMATDPSRTRGSRPALLRSASTGRGAS